MAKFLPVKKVILKKSTSSFLIIIFGLLSVIMYLLTLYGSSSGNFMIATDPDAYQRGIILSETGDFQDPKPLLFADSLKGVDHCSFEYVQAYLDSILVTDGNFIDANKSFMAYTFYLKNNGQTSVDISFSYKIKECYRNVDEAIRFLLIENNEVKKLYYKPDKHHVDYQYPEELELIEFYDSNVFNQTIIAFAPGQVKKYTIILYLEGPDKDCNDSLLGGSIKTEMNFRIIED